MLTILDVFLIVDLFTNEKENFHQYSIEEIIEVGTLLHSFSCNKEKPKPGSLTAISLKTLVELTKSGVSQEDQIHTLESLIR